MASRPICSGQLRLSLVSIPVELHAASRSTARISFRQIHGPSGKPVKYKKSLAVLGPIKNDDILKGHETGDGKYGTTRKKGRMKGWPSQYNAKRRFDATPEPKGCPNREGQIPVRGPSDDAGARRLAVRTEDHPLDYAQFEMPTRSRS
jgi:hypothetical protein